MPKPTAQQCHALTTYFVGKFREVQGREPVFNRNKARYGFEGILMDFSPTEARELVDYYIEHYENPSIDWLTYNYEKVVEAKTDRAKQEEEAAKRRAETAKRLEEWRNRWQK